MSLTLNNRTFIPFENSEGGVVDERTQFHFTQTGQDFTADYQGGDILSGHIIGRLTDGQTGEMLYHCQTTANELKAGQASATFKTTDSGQIRMSLKWEWLGGGAGPKTKGSGTSEYITIDAQARTT